MPPMTTERPYVRPRLIATTDALDLVPLEPEEDVEDAPPEPAPPKEPNPVDVAAAPPDVAAAVLEVALTRVGFWAPQGCAVRQVLEHALFASPQLVTHWLANSVHS